jgi:polygalacturonase
MKKLLVILSVFLLSLSIHAKTINVSDYGVIPDDGIDDTNAVRDAVEKLINNGGGTLVFPGGTTDISGELNFQTYGSYQSYLLTGDRGAFIRLNGTQSTDYFIFGNSNQVEIEGLIFYAPQAAAFNANRVIVSNYTAQTQITNCSFFGIGAKTAIIEDLGTNLIVEKTQFEGSAALVGVIHTNDAAGVSVSNTSFIDFANFLNMYLSKTAAVSTLAWINIENNNPAFHALGQRLTRIKDSRFDEGALNAIRIKNQRSVDISGVNVNISGVEGSSGIVLDNIRFAEIKFSSFGFAASPRPSIKLSNRSVIEATALTFDDAVYFITKDTGSSFTIKACAVCIESEQSSRGSKK